MNEMEMELNRLLHAIVGTPPRHVTVRAVRRKVVMRRLVMCVCATAVLGVAASAGLAVSAGAAGRSHAVSSAHRPGVPRYYFESGVTGPRANRMLSTVRAVASGAVKALIRCPGSHPAVNAAAAADNQVFFVSCLMTSRPGTQIYRFTVSRSGRVSGFALVRGGTLAGLRSTSLATTADGSELAIDAAPRGAAGISEVVVINTRTGAHAVWHSSRLRGGLGFTAYDLSFADGGRELAVLGFARCVSHPAVPRCKSPGQLMVAVNHAARGGRLANSRVIFTQAQIVAPRDGWIDDAFINPDGAGALVASVGPGGAVIDQISAAPGSTPRLIYRAAGWANFRLVRTDPSGRFLILAGLEQGRFNEVNGWLKNGRLVPLKPTSAVYVEAW